MADGRVSRRCATSWRGWNGRNDLSWIAVRSGVLGSVMNTITKKDLVDRIADETSNKRIVVKKIVQSFLDEIITELGNGNRLEFRDFGVFEIRSRAARVAQNPKTMQKVFVPTKRTVKFKIGRLMKERLFGDDAKETARRTAKAGSPEPRAASEPT
jgi:integration host factor subunit beta